MDENYRMMLGRLREKVETTVLPLITGDVHLTNLPYHANIGDSLIWRGTEDVLRKSGHRIVSRSSFLSWRFPRVKPGDVIVINGGGNFGDIWRIIMDVFIEIIRRYPDNRIIILSQSGWYDDSSLIEKDATVLAGHKDLHLIARDRFTYELFATHFLANHSYLAPDMAFAIDDKWLDPFRGMESNGRKLYLRRVDKEWVGETAIDVASGYDISDWPTITSPRLHEKVYFAALNRTMFRVGHGWFTDRLYWPAVERSGRIMCLRNLLKRGALFVGCYDEIITTRLHTLILAALLGKEVQYIDNVTRKLSAYAETWLSDFQNIRPYEKHS